MNKLLKKKLADYYQWCYDARDKSNTREDFFLGNTFTKKNMAIKDKCFKIIKTYLTY